MPDKHENRLMCSAVLPFYYQNILYDYLLICLMLEWNPDKLTAAKVNIFIKVNVFFMDFLQTIAKKVKWRQGDRETGGQGEWETWRQTNDLTSFLFQLVRSSL